MAYTVTMTSRQLERLYFALIVASYNSKASYERVLRELKDLGQYIDTKALRSAYDDAIEYLIDVEHQQCN